MLAAYEPLRDARWALHRLEDADDGPEFRVYWASTVVLLRAVGHVLDKIDGASDPSIRTAVDTWWTRLNANPSEHPIFWEFVDKARNNLLKEYEIGYQEGEVSVQGGAQTFTVDAELFKPMLTGLYAGEDARDVAAQAATWWERQLREIQNAVHSRA